MSPWFERGCRPDTGNRTPSTIVRFLNDARLARDAPPGAAARPGAAVARTGGAGPALDAPPADVARMAADLRPDAGLMADGKPPAGAPRQPVAETLPEAPRNLASRQAPPRVRRAD